MHPPTPSLCNLISFRSCQTQNQSGNSPFLPRISLSTSDNDISMSNLRLNNHASHLLQLFPPFPLPFPPFFPGKKLSLCTSGRYVETVTPSATSTSGSFRLRKASASDCRSGILEYPFLWLSSIHWRRKSVNHAAEGRSRPMAVRKSGKFST